MNVFTEKHLDDNPYAEVYNGSEGKVAINTSYNKISFESINIKDKFKPNYIHVVRYKIYLSKQLKGMKYAKNCGHYFINKIFKDENLKEFEITKKYKTIEEVNGESTIEMEYYGLDTRTKYYGIVVAVVELFP